MNIRESAQKLGRRAACQEAAEAIASWLGSFRYPDGRVGMTVPDFVGLVRSPNPLFEAVMTALKRRPDWDPEKVRENKAVIRLMGEERMIRQKDGTEVLIDEGKHDYWQILRDDALHERHHEHALAVSGPDLWPHFMRQMDAARDILLRV